MSIKNSSVESQALSFETPACRDMGLGAEELNRIFGIGSCRIRVRKEFDCEKKT
jgi:hypothetical protein